MKPIAIWPAQDIRYVLADIDDTITDEGRLPSASLSAMEQLQLAGIKVVPITGRPAGWCDHIARMWPVDGIVGENGALYFAYDHKSRKMHKGFAKPEAERKADRVRLDQLAGQILQTVKGTALASDQAYRIADLAIDFCEDVEPLPLEAVDQIVALFEKAGATAKVSSIHVNGWFGRYDKLSMTKRFFEEIFGQNLAGIGDQCAYIGDSPNDQPMFAYFENSIGVANVRDFSLTDPPSWVTEARGGKGFQEFVNKCLAT